MDEIEVDRISGAIMYGGYVVARATEAAPPSVLETFFQAVNGRTADGMAEENDRLEDELDCAERDIDAMEAKLQEIREIIER